MTADDNSISSKDCYKMTYKESKVSKENTQTR